VPKSKRRTQATRRATSGPKVGPRGLRGPRGPVGPTGPEGLRGETGDRGEPGESAASDAPEKLAELRQQIGALTKELHTQFERIQIQAELDHLARLITDTSKDR
jgi:hypothetical protein